MSDTSYVLAGLKKIALRGATVASAAAVVAMILMPADGVAQTRTVTMAVEAALPPWVFTKPDGSLDGFSIDLAKSLCDRLEIECEISGQEWSGLVAGVEAGKYDMIVSPLSITPQRAEAVDFTIPYAKLSTTLLAEKGTPLAEIPGKGTRLNIETEDDAVKTWLEEVRPDIDGKQLGVQRGTISSMFVDAFLKDFMEVKEYAQVAEHDSDLQAGRIDMIVGNEVVFRQALQRPEMQAFEQVGPTFVGGVLGKGYGYAFKKGETELNEMFSAALKEAIEDGTIRSLADKWLLGVDVTP